MRKHSKISIRDIAEKTQVNISTVSRALNHSCLISKETTDLILRTAQELGYTHSPNIRNIAIILPDSQIKLAWYSVNLINALINCLQRRELSWEFINADHINILQERSIAGIISLDFNNTAARNISKKYNQPLVCINDESSHIDNVYSVSSDPRDGISLAVQYLSEFDHHKIAYISVGNSFSCQKRINAFREISESKNIKHICIQEQNKRNNFHNIIRQLYLDGYTSIIAAGESTGPSILSSLQYCRLKVPEDMSLITWEMPYVSQLMQPPLTTIEQDFEKLAENAMILLDQQLSGHHLVRDISIPYILHQRESVALPRA